MKLGRRLWGLSIVSSAEASETWNVCTMCDKEQTSRDYKGQDFHQQEEDTLDRIDCTHSAKAAHAQHD
jgi:hypothetical protein